MLPVFIATPPVTLLAPWPVMHRVHATAPARHVAPAKKAAKPATRKPTWIPKIPAPRKTASTSSGCGASCQWHKTDAVWAQFPAWVEIFAKCVSHHESWSGHMWTAENPISTASGGFQFIDGTWRAWRDRAGVKAPGHAAYASPQTQAYVFAFGLTHYGGRGAWSGTGCPGT